MALFKGRDLFGYDWELIHPEVSSRESFTEEPSQPLVGIGLWSQFPLPNRDSD